ncbi:phage tail protein [Candidatus Pacearchaeota archaeon]|jgi:Leucine-rich repeat (LRR) protein|nr:phage tail protein [Candidatus Pacearchaeota archaeon]
MSIVEFPDTALASIIAAKLGVAPDEITSELCETILTLIEEDGTENAGISDLTGMEYCTNLFYLSMPHNQVSDLSPLEGLTKLGIINLGWNKLTTLSGLPDLPPLGAYMGLNLLGFNNNLLTDISQIVDSAGEHEALLVVYVQHNLISDITAFEDIDYGYGIRVDLSDNYITDLKPLADNTNPPAEGMLLDVTGNPLSDISYTEYIDSLEEIGWTVTFDTDYVPPTYSETYPVGAIYGGDFEGFLTVLNDDYLVQTQEITDTVTNIFEMLLDFCWAHQSGTLLLGGIDTALDQTLSMTFSNKSLMKCFQQVLSVVGGYLSCRHDPNNPALRYIYLEELSVNSGKEVRLKKNLKSITVSADMSKLCTRMVPYGDGTGIDQLNLSMYSPADETATHLTPDDTYGYIRLGTAAAKTEYRCYKGWTAEGDALPSHVTVKKDTVDDTSNWLQGSDPRILRCAVGNYSAEAVYTVSYQHDYYMIGDTAYDGTAPYGRITQPYTDKSVTDAITLAIAARNELAVRQYPQVAYKISAIDLSRLTGREWERYDIGGIVSAIIESINIDVDVSVQERKQNLLTPEDIEYVFSNYPINLESILAEQEKRLQALEEEPLSGISASILFSGALILGPFIADEKNFNFLISDKYIRCNAVSLSFSETDDTGVIYPSADVDVYLTVDGYTYEDAINGVTDLDITAHLTTPILGTQHTINFENKNGESTVLHVVVTAQVYRRAVALF